MTDPTAAGSTATAVRSRLGDFVELTKPRLTSLVLVTAAVGFFTASGASELGGLARLLVGLYLVVGGANSLNQFAERDIDALMRRTRDRPLPSGRLEPREALVFGVAVSVAGVAWLLLSVNGAAAALAAAAWFAYVFVYTPMKRRTAACTLVGAIPGAIPPLAGWAAAKGTLDAGAWSLFAILFVWQIPHFFAIARAYREDYARAGLPIFAVQDPDGVMTGRLIVAYSLLLIPLALLPAALGFAGTSYGYGSVALGAGFVGLSAWSFHKPAAGREKWVFLGSLVYLTVLMALLLIDRGPAA